MAVSGPYSTVPGSVRSSINATPMNDTMNLAPSNVGNTDDPARSVDRMQVGMSARHAGIISVTG